MTRYHVNPETGNPNICRAKIRCDFAVDGQEPPHFDTKEAAKKHAESEMNAAYGSVSTVSKPKARNPWAERKAEQESYQKNIDKYEEEVAREQEEYYAQLEEEKKNSSVVYKVTEANYDKAIDAIEKVNRKLERAGITDKFEYEVEEKTFNKFVEGREVQITYYEFGLSAPVISYTNEGRKHDFEAVITRAEAGFVTRSARGVDLKGWKPEDLTCDHCGQKRDRNKTYIVKDPDGNRLQIGSGCVAAYLGAKPAGLWALSSDPLEEISDEMDTIRQSPPKNKSEDIMSTALAISGNGEYFMSKSQALNTDSKSTYTILSNVMLSSHINTTDPQEQEYYDEIKSMASRYKENGRAADVLEQLKNLEGEGDYIDNVRVLANGEYVSSKDIPTLISGIAVLKRQEYNDKKRKEEEQRKAKKVAEFTSGHYGEIDSKIEKGTTFTLYSTKNFTSDDYWGNPISKTIVTAKDEEGHQVTWFTGVEIEAEPGDDIVLSSGKVKKHGSYQGIDQTTLSNVRLLKKK